MVTVDEVCAVPGDGSLVAPEWVPWSSRIEAGDITPGVVMPTADDDPRLEAGFTGGDTARDADPAEWQQLRSVVAELGLGRERVLSVHGRDEAADRWVDGDGGPHNSMTKLERPAPARYAYFIRLSGSLGRQFGVCANEFSPSDAQVVTVDHGCLQNITGCRKSFYGLNLKFGSCFPDIMQSNFKSCLFDLNSAVKTNTGPPNLYAYF